MYKFFKTIFNKLNIWWNQISYIDIEMANTGYVFRFKRKNVSIGYEIDQKLLTLKDIKIAHNLLKNIYLRVFLSNVQDAVLLIPTVMYKDDIGWFESNMIKIGSDINKRFYLGAFNAQDIKSIKCYGRWYRFKVLFFKNKPYIRFSRSMQELIIPWDKKDLKEFGVVNKEQAVSVIDECLEIRWNSAVSVFIDNNEEFTTWQDIKK